MSTFCGRMNEVDYISIDRFTCENLKSHAFFLSHCHMDHMHGIETMDFEFALQHNNAYFYMSHISKAIIEKKYPTLSVRLKELEMPGKNFIDIPNIDKTISVTLIPAGHCPGSVMFLFETENKTLLYTGDIRIRVNELKKFKELYDSTGILKRIDNIYLDTTFFSKLYEYFPPRDESIKQFCTIINNWLKQKTENIVSITIPANFGSEYLLMEIVKNCKSLIHVNQEKYDIYNCFPEMDKMLTLNANEAKLHVSCCGFNEFCSNHALKLKPSALTWKEMDDKTEIVKIRAGVTHICYSSHCSYRELIDILKFLKPLEITPCVVPKKPLEKEELDNEIKNILEELHKIEMVNDQFEHKTDWTEEIPEIKTNNEINSDFFDILNSPELKRKKI